MSWTCPKSVSKDMGASRFQLLDLRLRQEWDEPGSGYGTAALCCGGVPVPAESRDSVKSLGNLSAPSSASNYAP